MSERKEVTLGVDLGTSAVKAVVIATDGAVVAEASRELSLSSPRPLWSEQDPRAWRDAAREAIRAALASAGAVHVGAIGLTGQMHGLVLLDAGGEPLRPAILWNDQRTAAECAELTQRIGERRVLELTGNPVLTGFTAPKLLWVRRHEADVFARVRHALLPKDYLRYCLSGECWSDVSDASGTSWLGVARREWSDEMIAAGEARREWLPEVAESCAVVTRTAGAFAESCGLTSGVPIVAGAGDQAAQAVGCGTIREGVVSVTIGTSGVVFAASDAYVVEPRGRLHAFCHATPGRWHLMGVMLSAGGSFRWMRDTLCGEDVAEARRRGVDAYELMTAAAASVPAGCDGLNFLPYLTGERTPHADPLARAAFVGLTARHTRAHLTRAVMEGVTFGLRDSLELVRGLGVSPSEIRASGGGASSGLWRQMLADVFGVRIVTTNAVHGAAFGAAVLAAVGAGWFASVEAACAALVRVVPAAEPAGGAIGDAYHDAYSRHRALYPALKLAGVFGD